MTHVTVAVIDSGVNVPHPHLPAIAGGVAFDLEGTMAEDYVDTLGHGTAAASAIHERAPDAEIWAVKVFDRELATTVPVLVRAIDWATEQGMRLVNLSLGTPKEVRRGELAPAVQRAVEHGSIIVSAREHEGTLWLPGSMPGVVGVVMDPDQPRDTVTVVELESGTALRASPYPRPIPGVPRERNFNGISFAVANAAGVLAALLAGRPEVTTATDAMELLRRG